MNHFKCLRILACILILPTIHTLNACGESYLEAEAEHNGLTCRIQANVDCPSDKIYIVTLVQDEESFYYMTDCLLRSNWDQIKTISNQNTIRHFADNEQQILGIIERSELNGKVVYTDFTRDWNAANDPEESSHSLDEWYLTEKQPAYCTLTPKEAKQNAEDWINFWTHTFSFQATNLTAECSEENGIGHGGYYVRLQATYDGIPLNQMETTGGLTLQANLHIDDSGVYYASTFLLEEETKQAVSLIDVSEIASQLLLDFYLYSDKSMIINSISLQYKVYIDYSGLFTLRPVWRFSGKTIKTDGYEEEIIAIFFYADNGSWAGNYTYHL